MVTHPRLASQLPEMDGPQTLAALKQIDPEVVCCFMSALADAPRIGGAIGFLRKPFALDDLQILLAEHLQE